MSYASGGKKISDEEVAGVAYKAGFRGDPLVEIVARCWIESSGYCDIVNDSSQAQGLWQILPAAHPEYKDKLLPSLAWTDPQTNANMAYAIYVAAGNSMNPWASDGTAWIVNIQRAKNAVAKMDTTGTSSTTGSAPDASTADATLTSASGGGSVGDAIKFVTDPHNWFRLALFLLGGMAVLFGLWYVIGKTSIGESVHKTVGGLAKGAGAVVAL